MNYEFQTKDCGKKPDIQLYNNADIESLTLLSTQLIVTSNGNVSWLSSAIFQSSCMINVRYFPFDVQNCSLTFASWTFDASKLNLTKDADIGDASNFIQNGEWELMNLLVERNEKMYSCCPEP